VKLPEGSDGRPSFGRKPKDALPSGGSRQRLSFPKDVQKKVASFGNLWRFLRKAATPPEVKLSEGSRRKPKEAKQVQKAEGIARGEASSLPSGGRTSS